MNRRKGRRGGVGGERMQRERERERREEGGQVSPV